MRNRKAHNLTNLLDFFGESGQLKRVRRSGWWTAGIKNGESVADHSFRCAIIGYCLAHLEGCNPLKVAVMCLFNDIHEARINDLHKVAINYIELSEAERKALSDQIANLPSSIRNSIKDLMNELWCDKSRESIVARDADILECMLQGKEYYEQGYTHAREFYEGIARILKTKSARLLAKQLKKWDSYQWCQRLVHLER